MRYPHSSDEDDDDDNFFVENCEKDLDALRHACRLYQDELSGDSMDEGDNLEDDDALLLSIQKRFGASSRAVKPVEDAQSTFEEEDDEEILRAVEKRFSSSQNRLDSKTQFKSTGKINETDYPGAKGNHSVTADALDAERRDVWILEGVSTQGIAQSEICSDVSPHSDLNFSQDVHEDKEAGDNVGFALPGQVEIFEDDLVDGTVLDNSLQTDLSNQPLSGSARNILNALKKNRLCQKVLRSKLVLLELKLKENEELKKQVKTLLDFEKICRRTYACFREHDTNPAAKLFRTGRKRGRHPQLVGGFKQNRQGPPENEDAHKLREVEKKFFVTFEPRIWSREERKELVKGVKQQIQEQGVRFALEALNSSAEANIDDLISLDEQIHTVAKRSFTQADMQAALPGINWNEVARVYVVDRTPMECKIQWFNHEDPSINHSPWSKMEDKRLWSIARKHQLCNWDLICQDLGTQRTVAQCLIRYQRSLNAGIMRSSWTQEEDEQLRAAVELYGEKDWPTVAASLEGRTGSQCWNRWHKILHPIRTKSGRWDVMEDKWLRLAVSVYGPKMWRTIATHVPGRTEVQCRERWCNVLDPSLKLGEWTEEEDKWLEEAVMKHGQHHWSAVANDLKPRTDNQCWRRWKHLHPEHLIAFQKDLHIQKAALINNFVGRSKERPGLSPADFVSDPSIFSENAGISSRTCKMNGEKKHGSGWKRDRLVKKQRREVPDDAVTRDLLCMLRSVTPEHAKIYRSERIQKIKIARAAGKMQCWKRPKAELNTVLGTPGHMTPKTVVNRGSKPLYDCSHRKDGTVAFMRFVKEVTLFCCGNISASSSTKGDAFKLSGSSCSSIDLENICEENSENQRKSGAYLRYLNSDTKDHFAADQDSAHTIAKDEEIGAAVKAVLSWPFFFGLQEFCRKQCEEI